MSYYVLKHSAKGTTWSDHKYIRKEGNRYIYPEDVKKSANDNIEKQKELNEENTENDTRYEKALNNYLKTISKDLNIYTITEYEHEKLYKNDPKYKELSDLYDEEFSRSHQAKWAAEKEKQDYINKASENKQNRILSEAKKSADNHRQEGKEEHDSRAAQAAAEKETYLKRAENKKKVENKRDRLEYIRNARKTRNRDKKYVVDTEDGGAFVTRNREKAVQVRNEVKQNKLKREDPIKYYLQRRKSKRK